jgi:hypothetical protein
VSRPFFLALFTEAPWRRFSAIASTLPRVRSTDIDNIWPKKWQQCGSNREWDRTGRRRKSGPMEVGFSAYLSHIPGHIRTHPDMLTRIVAPKDAGSSPVGHPFRFCIGKPKTRM